MNTFFKALLFSFLATQAINAQDPNEHWPRGDCTAKNVANICEGSTDWMIGLYQSNGLRWGLIRGSSAAEVQQTLEERQENQTLVAEYSGKNPCVHYSDNYCSPSAPYCRQCFPNIRYSSQNTDAEQIKSNRTLHRLNQWSEKVDRVIAPFKDLTKEAVSMIEKEGMKAIIRRAPNLGVLLEQASEAQKKVEEIYSKHEDFIRLNELSMEAIDDLMTDSEGLSDEIEKLESAMDKISEKEKKDYIDGLNKILEREKPKAPPELSTPSKPVSRPNAQSALGTNKYHASIIHMIFLSSPQMVDGRQTDTVYFNDLGDKVSFDINNLDPNYPIVGSDFYAAVPDRSKQHMGTEASAGGFLVALGNAKTGQVLTQQKYISIGPIASDGLIQVLQGELRKGTGPSRKDRYGNEFFLTDANHYGRIYYAQASYGFVDQGGKDVIPVQFDHVSSPSEGLIPVQRHLGETWEYIDYQGRTVLGPQNVGDDFFQASSFVNGRAFVELKSRKRVLIDKNGRTIKELDKSLRLFDETFHFNGKRVLVAVKPADRNPNLFGVFDLAHDEWIVNPKYTDIQMQHALFVLRSADEEIILNSNFNQIFKFNRDENFLRFDTPTHSSQHFEKTLWQTVHTKSTNTKSKNRIILLNTVTGQTIVVEQ